jgi:DNA repair protein RecO (recombination protein O)
MSAEKTRAIVIRLVEFSESSYVATLFTEDFGKITGLAKGARRQKSAFENALDLLAVSRVVFLRKSSEGMDLLTEAKLERRFRASSRDLRRLYAGYYVAELLQVLTDERDPQPMLFRQALRAIEQLDGHGNVQEELLRFELAALRELGHEPILDRCVECGRTIGSGAREGSVARPGGPRLGDTKSGDTKSGDTKSGDTKSGDTGTNNPRTPGAESTQAAATSMRPASAGSRRRVAFGQLAGGALCEACRPGQRHVISLSSAAVQQMQRLLQPDEPDTNSASLVTLAGNSRGPGQPLAERAMTEPTTTEPTSMEPDTSRRSTTSLHSADAAARKAASGELRGMMNNLISHRIGRRPRMYPFLARLQG